MPELSSRRCDLLSSQLRVSCAECRTEFDGYSDDETVKVVMTGNQEPKFVDITDEAMENSSDVSVTAFTICLNIFMHEC